MSTDFSLQPPPRNDCVTGWLLIAIGIYTVLLVGFLNVIVLSSGKVVDQAIFLMADGMILLWIVLGGSLTPLLRRRLVPRLVAIPVGWRLRFVVLARLASAPQRSHTLTMG